MKNLSLCLAMGTLLLACNAKPTDISFLDKVLTVDEFSQQRDLRKRVMEACHQNPGQLGKDPNCINADKSSEIEFIKGKIPRF